MLKLALFALFGLTTIRAFPTDDECRLIGWVSISGQTVWSCTDVFCDNFELCTKDEEVTGTRTTVVCHCGTYTPANECEGVGYYDMDPDGRFIATYTCFRNNCPAPCSENAPANPPTVTCKC